MSSNLPLVHLSHRVLPFLLNFRCMAEGDTNIPLQQIYANSKEVLIIEGGVMSSEYGIRESVDSLCRDIAPNVQYVQYLSKSRITSPQTHERLI